MSLCPRSRVNKLNEQEQAVFNCKICRDKIKTYIKRLQVGQRKKMDLVKLELKDGNRDAAKMYLNQSKLLKEQIKVAEGQLNMIEEQVARIETAEHQKDAIRVLEQGNAVLKKLNEEVNVEKWERMADDMSEIKQQHDEIGNFLRNHNINHTDFDEEIEKEMSALMKVAGVSDGVKLPNAGVKEHTVDSSKSKLNHENKQQALEA
jgi:charged multivesicular body protein 6